MATNKEVDAPAAATEETPSVKTVETPIRSRQGLKLGGIIAGGVLAAALLFGGGVLVGTHLPDGGRPGFSQGMPPAGALPLGERPGGRERPGGDERQDGPQQGGGQPPQQQEQGDDVEDDDN